MISFGRGRKESKRELVMNMSSRTPANRALAVTKPNGLLSGLTPANASGFRFAAAIACVIVALLIFGLPFCHAQASAENLVGMEIGCGPLNVSTAPRARLDHAVTSGRVWPPLVCDVPAIQGAVFARPVTRRQSASAYSADATFCFSKSKSDVAGVIAELGAFRKSLFCQRQSTVFAIHRRTMTQYEILVKHGIEIDAGHFATMRTRLENELRQGLLPLTHNSPIRINSKQTGDL